MHSTNLIQLAPTLSAEERFKLIVKDFQKELAGDKPALSEAERAAIVKCKDRPMWEEYTRRIGIMQWADAFWTKDIETEKFRVFACSLMLGRSVDRLVAAADMPLPEKMRDALCAEVEEHVRMLEKNSVEFYAYREAVAQIERELYGMPLFNEKKKAALADYYEWVDEMFERYNTRIRMLCEGKVMEENMKPIIEHMKSYIAKKPVPDKKMVDKLVGEVMVIVDAEMDMLGR